VDLPNLIALVGGTIGGWTGMSFITYVQLIIFVLAVIWKRIQRLGAFFRQLWRRK
jgi:hypothetical protein